MHHQRSRSPARGAGGRRGAIVVVTLIAAWSWAVAAAPAAGTRGGAAAGAAAPRTPQPAATAAPGQPAPAARYGTPAPAAAAGSAALPTAREQPAGQPQAATADPQPPRARLAARLGITLGALAGVVLLGLILIKGVTRP